MPAVGFLRVGAALVVVLALLAGPSASAQDYATAVGNAALESLDYPWRDLGWTIQFLPGRSGYLGLARGPKRTIEIYVRPEHDVDDVAHTLAHELGHAVDLTYGSEYRRREYRRLRGLSLDGKWFGCDSCTDYATPAGDFAEVFEYWLLGGSDYRSQMAYPPDEGTLAQLQLLFEEPFKPSASVFWRQRWQPTI
jgi:hypothetical protein